MKIAGNTWWQKSVWVSCILAVGGISAAIGVMAVVYAMVYFGDDSHLKKTTILARINEETAIYMMDEETQIGSIFADSHRRYVPIDEVPAHMINAIIASEDKNFYRHNGVDPRAIVIAGIDYLRTGRMRGASTLTQQTVRNILGWWEVTIARKFREWIAALQLERLYSKRQILEFYLNQFHVSGNGNGIGIAARYYFNKDVRDLDLVESAFIAGSVKGPSNYDPFIKFTKESREAAIKRAYHRKNYVLKRMFEQGWINEEEFKVAWEQPIQFNRGRFRSDEVALVQLVRAQLDKKEILDALGIEDPRELSRAGLRIFTTIDADMQKAAQLAMRRNLSRLETILEGFQVEKEERFEKRPNVLVNEFYYAKVTDIKGTKDQPEIHINFGLPNAVIPFEALKRYAMWLDLSSGAGWRKQLSTMMEAIKPGSVLFVEIKEYDPETHLGVAELHKRPRINGGMIAIDKGEVRAVVSGFDTKGFNRAMSARRPPGSVFKSVVYFAALQLGWSIIDRVDNEPQLFAYQGRFYYPRADHDSPYHDTSILWSGITSENLASVALTSRLVEKLNFEQFKQLLTVMDLMPQNSEPPRDYHYRVAREIGVQLDNDGVKEFQLRNALSDLQLDLQFGSSISLQERLRKMWWGRGYLAEIENILADEGLSANRRVERMRLLLNNYKRLDALGSQLAQDWQTVKRLSEERSIDQVFRDPSVQHIWGRFKVLPGSGSKPALGFMTRLEGEASTKHNAIQNAVDLQMIQGGRRLNQLDAQAVWGGNLLFGSADIELGDVLLDGWLPYKHLQTLRSYVEKHYQSVQARQEPYDLHRYWQHHDFRIGLGLKYLVQLTKAMGVTSRVDPILSYPLGTNDVSAAEVAMIYQTFIDGKVYRFFKKGPPNQLNFIRRIEDRYGNVLYEPEPEITQLVDPAYAMQMRAILRRVVTHGTGRRARGEIYATLPSPNGGEGQRIGVPAFGKTGTTNDYTNAYFAGFLPYPTEKGQALNPSNSYVIASYVGYDFNKSMRKNFLSISGAQGALPAWYSFARSIVDDKKYTDYLDTLDLGVIGRGEWSLEPESGTVGLRVDMPRGVLLDRGAADGEVFTSTDIEREGETRFDEFRANIVQAVLRLPLDDSGSPLRQFSPFKVPVEEDQETLEIIPSGIDAPNSKNGARAAQPDEAEVQAGNTGNDSASLKPSTDSRTQGNSVNLIPAVDSSYEEADLIDKQARERILNQQMKESSRGNSGNNRPATTGVGNSERKISAPSAPPAPIEKQDNDGQNIDRNELW